MNTVQILERLIGFPTVSRDSNLDLIGFVQDFLGSRGIESRLYRDAGGTKANLYASIGPRDRGGVLLSGHTDVVPADGQRWSSDPFTMTARGGAYYGRGAADMKGFLAAALAAMDRARRRELSMPLEIAFSYDEEVGCLGVRSLIADMASWTHRPRFCIVGEPTLLRIATGHKGKTALRASCHGLAAHSAYPNRGVNAIYLAADFITRVRARQRDIEMHGRRDPGFEVPYTTLHVGTIRGGTALNIVPDRCDVELEVRNLASDDPRRIVDGLREDAQACGAPPERGQAAAGIELAVTNEYPGLDTAEDSDVVALVASLVGHRECVKVGFGSEGGLFAGELGIPTVVCGPGSINDAHKPDEHVTAEQLVACDAMLDALIERLA